MTDDIIKRKLKEVELKYKLTPRYFQIKREINMTSKEPAWFKSFRLEMQDFKNNQEIFNRNQENFNNNIIQRLDNLDNKVSKLESYHK